MYGLGFRVHDLGFTVKGSGSRVLGFSLGLSFVMNGEG